MGFRRTECALVLLGFVLSSVIVGCGSGDSTHVQVTEEAKAQIQSRRDVYSQKPKRVSPPKVKSGQPAR